MRHESISVVYDSSLAIADEIADKLGAQTVSVQSLSQRGIESCQSFVLGIEIQNDGNLTPHWQYGYQMLSSFDLSGKAFAVYVALGTWQEYAAAERFCNMLKERGAHVVSTISYVGSPQWNTDYWIGTVSPSI